MVCIPDCWIFLVMHILPVNLIVLVDVKQMVKCSSLKWIKKDLSSKQDVINIRYGDSDSVSLLTFEEILEEISLGDMLEPSYASKMLATLNPEKPIWDSRVKSILEFNIQGNTREKKKESIINIYYCIEETYKSYLESAEGIRNIELFDRIIGYKYPSLSKIRKLDFMIWGLGALREDIFVKMLEVKQRN